MDFRLEEMDKLSSALPKPVGWKLLLLMPAKSEKVGTIIMPDSVQEIEKQGSMCAYVLDVGAEAYTDQNRYSTPWCKKGDYVIIKAFEGTRFEIGGRELRLINEDTVQAVVPQPQEIKRL